MAAELLSGATLPEAASAPTPIFMAALVVAGGYASAAIILRRGNFDAGLRRTSDVALLLVVTIISSGLVACGFVASYAVTEVVPWTGFAEAVFQYWVGDAIGIVVLAPPLLLLKERIKGQTAADPGAVSTALRAARNQSATTPAWARPTSSPASSFAGALRAVRR